MDQLFSFNLPPHDIVVSLTSKEGFRQSANLIDAPIPRTHSITRDEDLEEIRNFEFPIIFKPNIHSAGYVGKFKKAYKLETYDELICLYKEVRLFEPWVIVQEWIEGDDSDIYFCLQYRETSEKRCSQLLRKKDQVKSANDRRNCQLHDSRRRGFGQKLVELTDRYFSQANVSGTCSMEFKRHKHTGKFIMIEPTIGRSDYQEAVATWHGYNIPLAAHQHISGQPVSSASPSSNRYIWVDRDGIRSAGRAQQQSFRPAGIYRDALCAWNDPLPWLSNETNRVRRKAKVDWYIVTRETEFPTRNDSATKLCSNT